MSNVTAPVIEIISRLHFHAETGYTPPGGTLTKLLDGIKIFDDPTARNQEQQSLPNLVIDVPDFQAVVEPHHAYYGESEIVLELSVAKEKGLQTLIETADLVISALLRDRLGDPDHHLSGKAAKQIVFSYSDGIASEVSYTLPITVRWRTKAFR